MIFKQLFVFLTVTITSFLSFGNIAFSWELYDDFSSGTIDPALWGIVATHHSYSSVTVVNGKLQIRLRPVGETSVAGVEIAQNPKNIKAIKVKVRVKKCTEDGRARIRVGRDKESIDANYYQAVNFFGDRDIIEVWVEKWHLFDSDELYWWTALPFHNPTDIIGKNFTTIIRIHPDKFEASIKGLGKVLYKPNNVDMTPESEQRIALDVKSSSGTGEVVVLYDDVYVKYY